MKNISLTKILYTLLFILAAFFTLFAPFINVQTLYADSQIKRYYYITQNTSMIPKDLPIKGNIGLNASYYVEATGEPDVIMNDIPYKYVIYNGITGLVQSSALSKKTINNIQSPFFISTSKLTVQATNANDYVILFKNISDASSEIIKMQNNTKLDFIAYSEDGNYILARLADNNIGYVEKKFCTPTIIYTLHPNPINPDTEGKLPGLSPDNPAQNTNKTDKTAITRVILIITLCVVVVIVIFLLFKPSSKKHTNKQNDFYDY